MLNKRGRLTPHEWEQIKQHPAIGARLTRSLEPWLGDWVRGVGEHHERWDGDGYPAGPAGQEISLAARIIAVADAFDVMTAARSYKDPLPAEAARAELVRCAGTQFDDAVVRAFVAVSIGKLRRIMGPSAAAGADPGGRIGAARPDARRGRPAGVGGRRDRRAWRARPLLAEDVAPPGVDRHHDRRGRTDASTERRRATPSGPATDGWRRPPTLARRHGAPRSIRHAHDGHRRRRRRHRSPGGPAAPRPRLARPGPTTTTTTAAGTCWPPWSIRSPTTSSTRWSTPWTGWSRASGVGDTVDDIRCLLPILGCRPEPTVAVAGRVRSAAMAERTDWNPVLRGEFAKPYWAELQQFVADERARTTVYPPHEDVFAALHLTPFADGEGA